MTGIILFLIGLIVGGALWFAKSNYLGFRSQRPTFYAKEGPAFDLRAEMDGKIDCQGMIFDYFGRMNGRFSAEMNASWTGNKAEVSEGFVYSSGRKHDRQWTVELGEDGRFTAIAPDIIGVGQGQQSGATVRLEYRIRLPDDVGGHVLDVVDWMYLTDSGTILNRSEFRKFGIKVAELFATMRKID
ncbi:MAG: DUF3833 family protein [Pseudomonadota bacterium]